MNQLSTISVIQTFRNSGADFTLNNERVRVETGDLKLTPEQVSHLKRIKPEIVLFLQIETWLLENIQKHEGSWEFCRTIFEALPGEIKSKGLVAASMLGDVLTAHGFNYGDSRPAPNGNGYWQIRTGLRLRGDRSSGDI